MKRPILLVLIVITFITVTFFKIPFSHADGKDEYLTILFTHDLHDNYDPFTVDNDGKFERVGGFARMATAIKSEREKDPDAVLVDAGDQAMGTLFQTIYASHAPGIRMMGEMGYDAITFGNHEFDFRADGLARNLLAAKNSGDPLPEIVASNMVFPDEETDSLKELREAIEAYGVKPYTVIEKKGIKIGIIGLLGEEADGDAPMSEVEFNHIVDSSKEKVKILQEEENVDLIIAISHSGTSDIKANSEDEILAEKVPEIDVIVSGHSHTLLEEPIIINDTIIGSSGEYGEYLGVIKLARDSSGEWDLDDYRVLHINEDIPFDEDFSEKIDSYKEIIQKEYLDLFGMEFDEVLAISPFDFTPFKTIYHRHEETTIGNLIGDSFKYIVKENEGDDYEPIAASVVPVGNIRSSFFAGDITVSDVFNVSPLGVGADQLSGYPIIDIYLTGKELKTVAEVDASITPLFLDVQLYIAGLSYEFNPNRLIFNKVTDVKLQDEDGSTEVIDNDKLYRVLVGLYSAQMLPVVGEESFGLLSLEPKTKNGEIIKDFEAQILHLNDESGREIKEWYAIASYLQSFEKEDGVSVVSEYYNETHDRKIINESKNLIDLAKKPNKIALTLYGIVIVTVILFIFLIRFLVKRIKRIREKRMDRQGESGSS